MLCALDISGIRGRLPPGKSSQGLDPGHGPGLGLDPDPCPIQGIDHGPEVVAGIVILVFHSACVGL